MKKKKSSQTLSQKNVVNLWCSARSRSSLTFNCGASSFFFLNTITRKIFHYTYKLHMDVLHWIRERFSSCWEKQEIRHISWTDCMLDSPCFCQCYCWMSVKRGDPEGKTSVSCEYFDNRIADLFFFFFVSLVWNDFAPSAWQTAVRHQGRLWLNLLSKYFWLTA